MSDTVGKRPGHSGLAVEDDDFAVRASNSEVAERARRLKIAVKAGGGRKPVSARAGISEATLDNYTAGRDPKFSNIVAIARACGVRLEWLADGLGPMRPEPPQSEKPTAEAAPRHLFSSVNMDYLADAYEHAVKSLAARGHHQPDPRRVMQVTALLYDELIDAEDRQNAPAGTKGD